jgi:hypothetical protein
VIRNLVVLVLVVVGGFFLALTVAYDTTEPCRALAVEKARRAAVPTALAHPWTRLKTAKMSRWQCSRALLGSWQDRLSR